MYCSQTWFLTLIFKNLYYNIRQEYKYYAVLNIIFLFVQKQLSPIFKFTLQVKIPESKFDILCSELSIYNNYSSLEELYCIDALSDLVLYMIALVCQYNGYSMIYTSGRAMCKHYKTSHIKREECISTKWTVTFVQRLNSNHYQRYFQVNSLSSKLKWAMNKN